MKFLVLSLISATFVVSCVPSTPQYRIAQNPQKFEALSSKDQELVKKGQIRRGMSKDAVRIAWGNPSQVFENSKNGKSGERWDYTGTKPVYRDEFFVGPGYYGGFYGRGYYPYYGFNPSLDVTYVPYRDATVWFVGSNVDSWERLR
ncbi:hypothetical protein JIN85_15965 [Luteolibacter pohnpeiensis]|uniref:Lipoprotein n=1 Tax=Luteolibacter pohnpeiensis TaxID=454153 RepID=A0A934S6C6_9BACT|nr:hypothetical protein [Luteolibacter pohnpeiensis]MBK1883915.1 hypothetical protein [Luteolibacter pohnpeiensis]